MTINNESLAISGPQSLLFDWNKFDHIIRDCIVFLCCICAWSVRCDVSTESLFAAAEERKIKRENEIEREIEWVRESNDHLFHFTVRHAVGMQFTLFSGSRGRNAIHVCNSIMNPGAE